MANSLDITIRTQVADATDSNVINDKAEMTRTSVTERVLRRFSLADAAVDTQLDLGGVDAAHVLWLRSDKAITVKVGGTEALRAIALETSLTREDGTTTSTLFAITSAATLIYLSNSSGAAANVEVFIA